MKLNLWEQNDSASDLLSKQEQSAGCGHIDLLSLSLRSIRCLRGGLVQNERKLRT